MNEFKKGINRLHTKCIKWDLQKQRVGKDNLLPFWIADSDYPTCKAITKDIIKRAKHRAYGYTIVDEEYRDVVCAWVKRRYQYDIERSWIIPTPGVVNALYFAVHNFTNVNDSVLITTPVYNPFYEVIEANGRNLVCNKLKEVPGEFNTYEIDFDDLEEKLKQVKMYIFCSPHNPVGRVWTKAELDKVVALCYKYDVVLISDEIHCDIIMGDNKFYSVGHYLNEEKYKDAKIIVCTAPSKTFNIAGLLDSNVIIRHSELQKYFREGYDAMGIRDPNIFGICACMSAYTKGDKWVDEQKAYLTENRDLVYEFFINNIPKAKLYKLEGTYLMWFDMRFLNMSSSELQQGLIDHKVLVNKGNVYSSDYDGYIRFNIACGRKQLLAGLEYIKEFVLEKIKDKK